MDDDDEPLPDRDIAEYVRDVAAQLAVMARDAGLDATASAFELACSSASAALNGRTDHDA